MAKRRPTAQALLMRDLTVSVEDAAELLNLNRNSAYAAVREGSIPSIRVGRAIRVPTARLRAMLGVEKPREAQS
jgi:excisionase family DNA binding protein